MLLGRQLCRILEKAGYCKDHQTESHITLRNIHSPYRRLTVPNHKEVAKGTLISIIKEAGLSLDEFKELL